MVIIAIAAGMLWITATPQHAIPTTPMANSSHTGRGLPLANRSDKYPQKKYPASMPSGGIHKMWPSCLWVTWKTPVKYSGPRNPITPTGIAPRP
jgi:hypothetical protein